MKQENYAMLCDFYEFTMSNGYFRNGFYQKTVYFDVFFRDIPDGGGFAIAAGLEQVIDYVKELHFTEEDVAFLRSKQCFDEGFLTYLKEFHFSGDIWAVPEGTPVTDYDHSSTCHRSTVAGNIHLALTESPVFDCNQSQPDCTGSRRQNRSGVWFSPSTGGIWCNSRSKSCLYWRLCRNSLHFNR